MIDVFKVKTPSVKDLEKYEANESLLKVGGLEGEIKKPFYKSPVFLVPLIISVSLSVISMIISLFIR